MHHRYKQILAKSWQVLAFIYFIYSPWHGNIYHLVNVCNSNDGANLGEANNSSRFDKAFYQTKYRKIKQVSS